jgi:hypothetical protein
LTVCKLNGRAKPVKSWLIGELDPKQKITFDLVHELGEADASKLMEAYGEQEGLKHTTAWNNRLATLAGRGLVIEIRQGRAKRYRPLLKKA